MTAEKYKKEHGVRALDISKRLIDYGYHPPTNYFPLIVPEALMIEPTETECKETLDAFCDALKCLDLPTQGARERRVKRHPLVFEVFAQPQRLPVTELAQYVVIISTKRGLAVAHKIKGSHGVNLNASSRNPSLESDEEPFSLHCSAVASVTQ